MLKINVSLPKLRSSFILKKTMLKSGTGYEEIV